MSETAVSGTDGSGSSVSRRMQELLAQAVEEQVDEQRQVAKAMADLRAQVAELAVGLREQVDGLEQRVGSTQVQDELAALRAEVRALTDRVPDAGPGPQEVAQGVADRVSSSLVAALAPQVAELVGDAAAASEHRLRVHLDDVLDGVAAALVQRGRAAAGTSPPTVQPVGDVVAAGTPAGRVADDRPGATAAPASPAPSAAPAPQALPPAAAARVAQARAKATRTGPVVPPTAGMATEEHRRQPWWRPGD